MKYVHCLIFSILLLAISQDTYAQSRDQQLRARVDSVLTARYFRTPYDT